MQCTAATVLVVSWSQPCVSAGLLEVDSLVKIQSLGSLSGVNMLACKHYLLYPSLWVLHNGLMNWVSETSLPMETTNDCHVHHHI